MVGRSKRLLTNVSRRPLKSDQQTTEPEMKLAKRVAKLEQAEIFASSRPVLTRLEAALDAASLRITGKPFDAVSGDEGTKRLIWDDLEVGFIRNLTADDLERLIAECERSAFGNGTAARDAALGLPINEGIEPPRRT